MENKEYIIYTIDALIIELQNLIDIEVEDVYKLKEYEKITLNEISIIDTYMSIINLLKQIKNKKNESI